MTIGAEGILNQAPLDLAAWVERGVAAPPSSRYTPDYCATWLQPEVHLTAYGKIRNEVVVKVLQYDWYLAQERLRL